ncbi:polysaccharide deacetylase family protein [Clostridium lacusfryxellense]|uniref:polysaccharide deacetylase family protein n=1 Tax=Clostridium lacusfryxellense TaxID=205328 RepID=UPI001C0E4719|nr:polysaccharide deacetylase family protein [Clostridium lacusfryxellense]MBU3113418.1 polysaccharide deacetylase [Clostridium lacusfryxellense]
MNYKNQSILLIFISAIVSILLICLLLISNYIINDLKINDVFIPITTSLKDVGEIPTSKFAYLTFDDGPTHVVTPAILDILKKENVKATFFVVGKEIEGRENILKRIYTEGHSIGLHTYSHNFKKIYRSCDEFIGEMKKTSDKVKEVTGFSPKIIRFPGGSSKRLNDFTLIDIHKNNYKVYDWNVNICDGINPNLSVSELIKNSHTIKGNKNEAIILMHCNSNNKTTVKALSGIIKYYHDLGYTFKAITTSTPEYYYRFKN